jgi:hypothetical protein
MQEVSGLPIVCEHSNELGDWCPWSGTEVAEVEDVDFFCCPAGCRDSGIEEEQPRSSRTEWRAFLTYVKGNAFGA